MQAATPAPGPEALAAPLSSAEEFGRAMLAWAALLLRRQIGRARLLGLLPPPVSQADIFAGSYISDSDVENASRSLLLDVAVNPVQLPDELRSLDERIAEANRTLAARLQSTEAAGIKLPVLQLKQRFGLHEDETALLMLVIAAAMDARIRRLLAYLQNDFSKRRPDAGTVLSALAAQTSGAHLPWHLLDPNSTLRAYNLIVVQSSDRERSSWLMERPLSVSDSLTAFLARGTLWLDESIAPFVRLITPGPEHGWDALCLSDEDRQALRLRFEMHRVRPGQSGGSTGILLRGARGSGRKAGALAMCQEHGRKLLTVDASHLPPEEEAAAAAMRTVVRDARLHQAVIFVENADALRRDTQAGHSRLHAVALAYRLSGDLVLFSSETEERIGIEDELDIPSFEVPALRVEDRQRLWEKVLPPDVGAADIRYVATQFPTMPGIITVVGQDTQALQKVNGGKLTRKQLGHQILERSRHNLRAIATQVRPNYSWEDVILPDDIIERCRRIVQLVRMQDSLARRWGISRRLMASRGVSALFSGPPGVGKSMVAGIIGQQLGFDVFRIDISRILSKWVGETEKNLAKLFDEANRTRAVLIFDEADALFSKRTDVKSSSDRYSNVEVNYLLQKMESFEGVIVLTTNLEKGVDEAFVRRLNFKIRFPEPTPEERVRMWHTMLPAKVPLSPDVDLWELAEKFDVTGGFIRNAVIRATVIASAKGYPEPCLYRSDLLQAIEEELQESGRLAYTIPS
ncbi:MAG: ATP-binding protein [Polyangia bacterium]